MSNPRAFFKLKSGTELPLMNLRGREYLQVAHRLVWLVEETERYTIETEFLKLEDEYSICRSVVNIYNKEGILTRSASATKKETKKDFPDFVEKSETGSIGRALAMLSFGTQFSTQDMEEGNRLADSPLPPPGVQNVANDFGQTFKGSETPAPAKRGFTRKTSTPEVVKEETKPIASAEPVDEEWV